MHAAGKIVAREQVVRDSVEWPTLAMMAATYALWALGTTWAAGLWLPLGIALTAIATAQFSSLQHEVLHGHPFRSARANEALVFPALSLIVPYRRFRDTHLAHHHDPILTDPYDDPESNYLDPAVWRDLGPVTQRLLRLNNTLAGRVLVGPAISLFLFVKGDVALMRAGDRAVRTAWLLNAAGLVPVAVWFVAVAQMPFWASLVAVYLSHSLLKIRTFLEHRAHDAARARTVIIEDRGPLALLFLNNNLHVVHHMHPAVPWYRLPAVYRANREHYLRRNDGYVYRSYAEIFARFLFRAKDPVPHPLMPGAAPEPVPAAGPAAALSRSA
jgi:fatty acid desaturase